MPDVADIELLVYQKIRELLEGSTAWTSKFDIANRIWYDDVEGIQNPEKPQTADGDYPQSRMWTESGTITPYTDENFGTHAEDGPPHQWQERGNLVYVLELKSQTLKFGQITSLGSESRAAIRAGGPHLGLRDYVIGYSFGWAAKEVDRNEAEETMRWEIRVRITVQLEYQGRPLIGE